MCGLGVAVGWRMKHANLRVWSVLEGLRAGKRQAWTPIRSHGCVALGCLLAAGSMPRDGLSDPEEAIDVWPRGGCWLEDEACQFKGLERLEGLAAG